VRQGALDELDGATLADLRVVQVQVESQVRVVDGLDEREGVRALAKGTPGWLSFVLARADG